MTKENNETLSEPKSISNWLFSLIFIAAIIVIFVVLNLITGGKLLTPSNIRVFVSHAIYPTL